MMVFSTVEAAVDIVVENFEINRISVNTDAIRNSVYSWYVHSDVADPEILAACVLMGMDWAPDVTYKDMLDAKEQMFPQNPFDEFGIWEIEAAQKDMEWE